jgi:hypothetical protein
VLLSSSPMRLRCIFVKFSGFVVIVICHVRFLKFSSQRATTRGSRSRSGKSRNGAISICRKFHQTIGIATAVLSRVRDPRAFVEPPSKLAHTPLPKSSKATLNPPYFRSRICGGGRWQKSGSNRVARTFRASQSIAPRISKLRIIGLYVWCPLAPRMPTPRLAPRSMSNASCAAIMI